MKITVDINEQVLSEAKVLAKTLCTSVPGLIEEGLRLRLGIPHVRHAGPQAGQPAIPVFDGRGGLVAGVDPLSNRAMLDALLER